MGGVREFRREDIPEVAQLWMKVFRRRREPASESLSAYFREIFFENPWHDETLPSLVYEEAGHRIVGFLGVIPRSMTFNKQRIKVAVATQLMMDREANCVHAAAKLMRKFLAGKQDLSFSDGASEDAEELWRGAGGDVAVPDNMAWVRVLRPTQYASQLLKRRASLLPVARALWPLCQALDAVVVHSGLGRRYWLPESAGTTVDEQPSDDTLLWCVRNLGGNRALLPDYELDSFRWLLSKAADKKMFGELRKGVVRDVGGEILGWYLYYVKKGGVAEVLQFGGKPKSIRKVLNHLFRQAWRQGGVSISGRLESRFVKDLVKNRCGFTWPGYGTLIHSRNREILIAIHQGDAFLSRLEGEWWARFSDPAWSRDTRAGLLAWPRRRDEPAPQKNEASVSPLTVRAGLQGQFDQLA